MAKKIKKRIKIRILPILMVFTILIVACFSVHIVLKMKIENIIIIGNNSVTDQEIIDRAGVTDYPSFYKISSQAIKRKLLGNTHIKNVTVKKKFYHILEIKVEEYKLLYKRDSDKKIILETGEELLTDEAVLGIPTLLNYIPDTKQKAFLEGMNEVKEEIRKQISEITYMPNDYDKDRFLLTMNDGNTVYLTLTKFEMINYYDEVLPQLEGRKGILYLDSGNHFQIME